MEAINIHELELAEGWADDEETVRARFSFPITAASGAASTSVVYFELEPGNRLSLHTHTAEEVLLIVEGTAEAIVRERSTAMSAGGMALIPANVVHDVVNAGSDTLRCVGFFSSAVILNRYDHDIMPMGGRVLVFPPPDAFENEAADRVAVNR
ncbi:MAG TPA: cupin domain-containing protein [Gaiellaceae bacterium]|nr:cupin domain-containing protein [Gaiellaceae bacterium]